MKLHEALAVTYAVIGQALTDAQLAIMTEELEAYPLIDVLTALSRCRKQLRKISLVDILDRLPGQHPGPEEAWAIVARSLCDESVTVVWTDEMRGGFGVACTLSDDPIAARMAFKEHYLQQVGDARTNGTPPQWSVSQGTDHHGREVAILEGVKQGKLTVAYAHKLLPHPEDQQTLQMLEHLCPRLLS